MNASPDCVARIGDAARVFVWRRERLLSLGLAEGRACVIALSQIDIHDIERLVDRGCPLDVAIKIAA